MEKWKDVNGYEGLYQVSNNGRVKRIKSGRILSHNICAGYSRVILSKNNKQSAFLVHRLVAIAFIPNEYDFPCINHKDENKQNNNMNNLEWCTHKYNSNYGTLTKRIALAREIPVVQKTMGGDIIKVYKSRMQAERETGITHSNISACVNKKYKHAGGFLWD